MIKNNIKVSVLVLLAMVVSMGTANAVALTADLVFDANTVVPLNSNNYTIASGSVASTLVLAPTTMTVSVPTGSTFTLISYNSYRLGNSASVAQTCVAGQNSLTLTGPLTDVIITPVSTICSNTGTGGGGASGGGGGGGGGGGTTTTTTTTTPTTTTTTTPTTTTTTTPTTTTTTTTVPNLTLPYASPTTASEIAANRTVLLGYLVSLLQAASGATTTTTGTTTTTTPSTATAVPASGSYTQTLVAGTTSNDVSSLQQFLKAQGTDVYPEGKVTGYFGSLTKTAVGRFQLKYGIVSSSSDAGYGIVGPKTRTKINSLLGL